MPEMIVAYIDWFKNEVRIISRKGAKTAGRGIVVFLIVEVAGGEIIFNLYLHKKINYAAKIQENTA